MRSTARAALTEVLGDSVLTDLIGSTLPNEEVADRLSFLARVVGDLAGSYDKDGIQRWFNRPRTELSGKSPAVALREDWDAAAQTVQMLAESLVSGGAT